MGAAFERRPEGRPIPLVESREPQICYRLRIRNSLLAKRGKPRKIAEVFRMCGVKFGSGASARYSAGSDFPLSGTNMRVSQFLTDQHVAFETVVHPPAFTAQKRARFLHIPGRHVVKSVLLACDGEFVLAVLPATDHIDLSALGRCLGTPVRLATESELSRLFGDCERGALAPFGSLYGVPTILEDALDPETIIAFESQMHALAIKMRCRDFETLEKPRRCRFAAQLWSA